MKKSLSILLAVLLTLGSLTLPVAVADEPAEKPARDDVVIVFDGSEDNVIIQHPTPEQVEFSESNDMYVQGQESLFVDMQEAADCNIEFIGDFALMLKIVPDEKVNIQEFPLSELSFYNYYDAAEGDVIQINYVDPANTYGQQDDSYNFNFNISDKTEGWHRLQHNALSSALWSDGIDPTNISHVRISWRVNMIADEVVYHEIDWNFDCLLVAKQSFFDDRAVAEEAMIQVIDSLETPTAENFNSVKESILAAKEQLDENIAEFPNFMVENMDSVYKMDAIWLAYQQAEEGVAAQEIVGKIDALGEITAENRAEKEAEIAAIDAEIEAYVQAGYKKSAITNLSLLDTAKARLKALNIEADIAALPAVEEVTEEDEEAVMAVVNAVAALSDAEKELIGADFLSKLDQLKAVFENTDPDYLLGDVDEDGDRDAADALKVLQHAVKLVTLEGNPLKAADTTKDTVISAADALKILQFAVKLIDEF